MKWHSIFVIADVHFLFSFNGLSFKWYDIMAPPCVCLSRVTHTHGGREKKNVFNFFFMKLWTNKKCGLVSSSIRELKYNTWMEAYYSTPLKFLFFFSSPKNYYFLFFTLQEQYHNLYNPLSNINAAHRCKRVGICVPSYNIHRICRHLNIYYITNIYLDA
jgi:hypothetical protein